MKSRSRKQLAIAAVCLALTVICAFYLIRFGLYLSNHEKAAQERLEMSHEFYWNVLSAANESDEIEIASLIPAAWDRMYVFGAYTSQAQKFAAAGSEYNISVRDGVSEGLISMLFMSGDQVAYYVEFYPREIQSSYSIRLVIDTEFDCAVFEYKDRPRLVRSFLPTNVHTADEIVRFTLTAGN